MANLFAIFAALAAGHASDTINLSCVVSDGHTRIEFALNELSGTASYTVVTTGKSFQEPAVFTPEQVIIGSPSLRKIIDRRTLEIVDGQESQGQFHVGRKGTCKIAPQEDRKF